MNQDLEKFLNFKTDPNIKVSRWYLAAPYTHKDPAVIQERVDQAAMVAAKITSLFPHILVLPPTVLSRTLVDAGAEPLQGWYQWGIDWLSTCDSLFVLQLDAWENSVGIQLEIKAARLAGIPVFWLDPKAFHADPEGTIQKSMQETFPGNAVAMPLTFFAQTKECEKARFSAEQSMDWMETVNEKMLAGI